MPGACHRQTQSQTLVPENWGGVTFDPALNDSVCEASISAMDGDGNLTVFFNPAMQHMRNRPTLKFSFDGGRTWPKSTLVADSFVDYSSLVRGPLIRPPADYSGSGGGSGDGSGPVVGSGPVGGVLWGSCEVPVPYRLWCVPVDRIGPGMRDPCRARELELALKVEPRPEPADGDPCRAWKLELAHSVEPRPEPADGDPCRARGVKLAHRVAPLPE